MGARIQANLPTLPTPTRKTRTESLVTAGVAASSLVKGPKYPPGMDVRYALGIIDECWIGAPNSYRVLPADSEQPHNNRAGLQVLSAS
jgi:hypothetical protein